MGRFLIPVLGLFAWPKQLITLDWSKLEYLDRKTANILFAVAEAIIGEDFKQKVPEFIPMIDDYLAYQRRSQREALSQALLILENALFNFGVARELHSFTRMTIDDRRKVLGKLKVSDNQLARNIYAACVNISASAFYASPATWGSIQYDGVSVANPEVLATPRWRPGDSRPVEP